VSQRRFRLDPEMPEQGLTHDVRRAAARPAEADVDVRLSEVQGQQLSVAVGEVEQGDAAGRPGEVVQRIRAIGLRRAPRDRQALRRGHREQLQEFTPRD
jgi:hypothetical protein